MGPGPRLSPGRLTALWLVLRSLARLGGVAREDFRVVAQEGFVEMRE